MGLLPAKALVLSVFLTSFFVSAFGDWSMAFPPYHHSHHGGHLAAPELAPTHPPSHHHHHRGHHAPPTYPPVHPPSHPPIKPPSHPPVKPPSHPPVKPPSYPPVKPPSHPPVKPPSHPPVKPPSHPPVKPPVKPPSHPPVKPPSYPPVKPPSHPPVKPPTSPPSPLPTRKLVAVQGVVYCKSCKYKGKDTLLGAVPIQGATVKLVCKNTKYRQVFNGTTDKNGYFIIIAPKTISTYGAHKCKAFVVSSPLKSCDKPTDLHGGLTGSDLRLEKPPVGKPLPFNVYTVGPFAFESSKPVKCSP